MKNACFRLALIGGLLALAISLIAVSEFGIGAKWMFTLIFPGFYVGGLIYSASSSMTLAVIAGFLTMALLGGFLGYLVGLIIKITCLRQHPP